MERIIPYETSTDYTKLWKFINEGMRIPALVVNDKWDTPTCDIVEVKAEKGKCYMIGTRGIGYEGFTYSYQDFEKRCEELKLKYIYPNKQ